MSDFYQQSTKLEFINELCAALQECGFIIIKDHGIDYQTLSDAYEQCSLLFALTLYEKQQYQCQRGGQRGYTAFGTEKAKGSTFSDLKEFWHIGPSLSKSSSYYKEYPTNLWPSELPKFRQTFTELYEQLQRVAHDVLQALSIGLGIEPTYFDDMVQDGNSVLRLIHYPPVTKMDTVNQMRAAPHSDINLLTLLVCASASGLQLLDRNDQWQDIETNENEIVVDTGDMMALITGNKIPSTIHRVINPDDETKPRYSIPFFLHPHSRVMLGCLPQFREKGGGDYPSITAGDFLQTRLRENGVLNDN